MTRFLFVILMKRTGKCNGEIRGSLHCGGKVRRLRSRWRDLLVGISGWRDLPGLESHDDVVSRLRDDV